jgi:hypothetical protein
MQAEKIKIWHKIVKKNRQKLCQKVVKKLSKSLNLKISCPKIELGNLYKDEKGTKNGTKKKTDCDECSASVDQMRLRRI